MPKRKSEPFTAVLAFASIVALVGLGVAVPAFAQQGSIEKLKQQHQCADQARCLRAAQ